MYHVPAEAITWLSVETQRLYDQVLILVRNTSGDLNFHDALIALGCQELGVHFIASFDADFDRVAWLTRLDTPDTVMAALKKAKVESPRPKPLPLVEGDMGSALPERERK